MHILFLSDNFPPEVNASATRVYERALYWVKWGHKVTVITCHPNFPEGKVYPGFKNKWCTVEDMDGIRVVRVKTFIAKNSGFLFRVIDFISYMISAIFAGFFQKKPDVVISTSPQFFAAIGGWIIAKYKRRPFVFELGDIWPASITAVGAMKKSTAIRLLEKLELFMYRRSSRVVALTKSFKKNLVERGISQEKIGVVINGVELSKYHPQKKNQKLLEKLCLDGKVVIGYIGTHGMAHGLDNVVYAAQLLKNDPAIHFLFVGDGAEKLKLMQLAEDFELENITFVDKQPKNIISHYWSICDIALVHLKNNPVFSEVIPSKIFEAMGMGLPILLCSPEGEASDIINRTQAGWYVPAGDSAKLAEKIQKLSGEQEQISIFASLSHNAAKNYSREFQSERMIEELQSAVSSSRGD